MNRINFLPPWVETNLQPAFYDLESGTSLQQTARMYNKVNELVRSVNTQNETIADYIQQFIDLHNYVDDYFDNLDVQEEINNKLDQMAQDGELKDIFQDYLADELTRIETDLDNQIDEIEATVTSDYNTLNAKIDALSSGSPIPVSDVSDMTDTNRIYVLTTTGEWYYYNGATWAVGGQYQASQSTDDVEGLIYNEITNNLKYLLKLSTGYIDSSTYQKVSANNRICSNDFCKFNYDLLVKVGTNLYVSIYYYDAEGNHISAEPLAPTTINKATVDDQKYYVIPADRIFKISVDYQVVPEGGRPVITDVETSYLFNNLTVTPLHLYRQKQFNKLMQDGRVFDANNLINYVNVCCGDFSITTVEDVQYCYPSDYNETNNRRLIVKDMQHYDTDIVIKKSNVWRPYIYIFDENGDYQSGAWHNIDSTDYTIPAGTYFKMMMSILPTSSTTAVMDFYDNNIFKAIVIEKAGEEVVTEDRFYLYTANYNYVKSIAHQGKSYDERTYNQSRLGGYYKAKACGFDVGECDVKWTSDNVPVCCHDASFQSGGETIVIAEHTLAELQALDYYGSTIATLDSIVKACKEMGMEVAIDHLNSNWDDTKWGILFGIVEKYQMQNYTWWLQGRSTTLMDKILNWYSKAKIAITIGDADISGAISDANAKVTDDNEIMVNFNYANVSVNQMLSYKASADIRVKFGIWTNDNLTSCLAYLPYVDAITSNSYSIIDMNKKLYENNSTYFSE